MSKPKEKPSRLPERPDQVTVMQCPRCHEHVGLFNKQHMEVDEAGAWTLHRHQPKGVGPFKFDTRCCSSGPLTSKDFTL